MKLTKQQIKDLNIREYYILIDECNDDKLVRCTEISDVQEVAREYDEECDGEWMPLLLIYNRDNKQYTIYDDWNY